MTMVGTPCGTSAISACQDTLATPSWNLASLCRWLSRKCGLDSTSDTWHCSSLRLPSGSMLSVRSTSSMSVPFPGPSSTMRHGCGLADRAANTVCTQSPTDSPKICVISGEVTKSPFDPSIEAASERA